MALLRVCYRVCGRLPGGKVVNVTHCSLKEATNQVARESNDPDAVVCIVWWCVIAMAAVWAVVIYQIVYFFAW